MTDESLAYIGEVGELAQRLDDLFPEWEVAVDVEQLEGHGALAQITEVLRVRADDRWREVNLMHAWMSSPSNQQGEGSSEALGAVWQHEVERRTCGAAVRHCSCGAQRGLIAESATGIRLASSRGPWLDAGIAVARFRCTFCGSESYLGWVPPTWISAIAREAARIAAEMEESMSEADAQTILLCPPEGATIEAKSRPSPDPLVACPHRPVEPFQDQPTHLYEPGNDVEAPCGFGPGIVPGGNPGLCERCAERAERDGYFIIEPETPSPHASGR